MKIVKWGFKNLCSYGNIYKEINIGDKPKLVLIQGDNGHGKTTIGNGLEFSIYGKSSRRSIKNLPNWINKAAETYVNFITDDGRSVEVSRGLKPDSFDLRINNAFYNAEDGTGKQSKENVFSKTKLDNMIENELANIPFEIFTNNIILSIKDFKSFIKLKAEDKRKITDKIFDTAILNDMHTILKGDLKAANEELNPLNVLYEAKKQMVDSYLQQLEQISSDILQEIEKRESELNAQLGVLNKNIGDLKAQQVVLERSVIDIEMDISNISNVLKTKYEELSAKIIADANKEIDALDGKMKLELDEVEAGYVPKRQAIANAKAIIVKEATDNYNSSLGVIESSIGQAGSNAKTEYDKKVTELNALHEGYKTTLGAQRDQAMLALNTKYNEDLAVLNTEQAKVSADITDKQSEKETKTNAALQLQADLRGVNNTLANYEKNICDHCNNDLTSESSQDVKLKLIARKEGIETEYGIINGDIAKIVEAIDALKIDLAKYDTKKMDLYSDYTEKSRALDGEYNKNLQDSVTTVNADLSKATTEYNAIIANLNEKLKTDTAAIVALRDKTITAAESVYNKELEEINKASAQAANEILFAYEAKKKTVNDAKYAALDVQNTNYTNELSTSIREKNDVLNSENNKLGGIIKDISIAESSVSAINTELGEIRNKLDNNKLVETIKSSISQLETEMDAVEAQRKDVTDRIWTCTNTMLMFSDDGLKRMLMKQVLPLFNESIANLTRAFEFKYQFSFTEDFDPVITYMGTEISADAVSAGEEAIMDIIVVLSTLKLIILKHPQMNILFLDEIFSSLSISNIAKAINILKNYIGDYGLTIFVISHTPVPIEKFDNVIDVTFDNYFSDFKIS